LQLLHFTQFSSVKFIIVEHIIPQGSAGRIGTAEVPKVRDTAVSSPAVALLYHNEMAKAMPSTEKNE
jgi:hypothetical protein